MRGLVWVACGWMLVASAADGQGFGRNKVQYAEFAWRKMETAHFDVYFFAEEEELVRTPRRWPSASSPTSKRSSPTQCSGGCR